MKKLTGLVAAPFTPFDKSGELALDQIETMVQLYKNNGVNAAFICGTTGEGVSLTYEEKKLVMEQWGKVKTDSLKTIFMLGGTCLKEMQELALHAQNHKMDGISILSPFYFKPANETQLVRFCKAVADTAPELAFYYYHIPGLTGGDYSMVKFLEIADGQIPNLAGIKFSSLNIMDFHACRIFKNGKYNLLWGVDEALLSGLAAGADGAVGSTYNYAAPLYNQIIQAFQNGQMKEAEQLQQLAVKMVTLLIKYGGTAAGKAFMKLIGVDCGWFRPPVQSLSDAQVEALKVDLEKIDFFDFCSKNLSE